MDILKAFRTVLLEIYKDNPNAESFILEGWNNLPTLEGSFLTYQIVDSRGLGPSYYNEIILEHREVIIQLDMVGLNSYDAMCDLKLQFGLERVKDFCVMENIAIYDTTNVIQIVETDNQGYNYKRSTLSVKIRYVDTIENPVGPIEKVEYEIITDNKK